MGIFDIFFGGRKEPQTARQKPKIELRLDDILEFVSKKSEEKFSPKIKACEGDISQILLEFKEIEIAAKELAAKPVKTENPSHERIARQMKENYSDRLPKILLSVEPPKKNDYFEIRRFHTQIVSQLVSITKITSDNRYLPFFFKEEFEKLGEPIRRLAATVDELGKKLEESDADFKEGESLRREIGRMHALKSENGVILESITALEKELGEKRGKIESSNLAELENARSVSLREIAGFENKLSQLISEITSLVSPLERVLRKFGKTITDRGKANIVEEFLKDQIGYIGKSKEALNEYNAICAELEKTLLDGSLKEDEKDKAKHLELLAKIKNGKLGGYFEELILAKEGMENKRNENRAIDESISRIKTMERDFENATIRQGKQKQALLENQAKIESVMLNLEEGMGKWLDCEIKIKRE